MKELKNNGLVSIIVPVYNAGKVIERTIRSVQEQTYQDWELVMVDDCAKDNSAEVINRMSLADNRIKYYKLETNSGAAVARNHGINMANGRYLAFLDADDMWLPEKLQSEINLLKAKNAAFVYCAISMVSEDGHVLKEHVHVPETVNYNYLLKNTVIATSSVLLDSTMWGGKNASSPLWTGLCHMVETA